MCDGDASATKETQKIHDGNMCSIIVEIIEHTLEKDVNQIHLE
jgi:hypothetical protein